MEVIKSWSDIEEETLSDQVPTQKATDDFAEQIYIIFVDFLWDGHYVTTVDEEKPIKLEIHKISQITNVEDTALLRRKRTKSQFLTQNVQNFLRKG